jgi:hypothetical protein
MNFAVIVAEDEQVVATVAIRQNYAVVVVKAASCSPTKMHYGARFVFFHLILIPCYEPKCTTLFAVHSLL